MKWRKHRDVISGLKIVSLVIRIKDDNYTREGQRDINYYNREGDRIMEEIKTFTPNIQVISHSRNTNVITLSARWPRENLGSMKNRILKIRRVDGVFEFPNYIEELKDAMEMHDFFKVVAFSSTLLESYGKQILIKHFGEKNQDRDHDRIYNLTLDATAIMLYSSGIINKPLFDDIDDLRKKRNKLFIHRMSDPSLIPLLTKEQVKINENLANKAIRSVSKLMAICSMS